MSEPSTTREDLDPVLAPEPSATERAVDAWFVETFNNVPGLSTELYARFYAAKPRLKAALRALEV